MTSRDHALRIAVWSVIASEAVMFAALLVARGELHVIVRSPMVILSATVAAALFAGGAALATALRRTREGRTEAAARLLTVGAGIGLLALALELAGSRLAELRDPLSLAIIGLHAAHVGAAVALAAWVLALVRTGRVHPRHHTILALVASYWYFVAGVWVFAWPVIAGPHA